MTRPEQPPPESLRAAQPPLSSPAQACDSCVEAFILLAGGLIPSPLAAATRCSVLDLLVGPEDQTVLDRWIAGLGSLKGLVAGDIPIIIANGGTSPTPIIRPDLARTVEVVVDREDFRGAAGVVCDVSLNLGDEAILLVAEAARCPDFDLKTLLRYHQANDFETTVLVNSDGTPGGVYVIARHLMRYVQREGYMDLKEQWLAKVIEGNHRVGAFRLVEGCSRPLRTREQLLHAAHATASPKEQTSTTRFGLTAEARRAGFRRVATDARVDLTAVVIDSIIMSGASIGPSCVVTRSIVCAGAHVSPGTQLIDAVYVEPLTAGGPESNEKRGEHNR